MKKVLFGIDQFCEQIEKYKNIRLGLVTNDAAFNAFGKKSRVALIDAGFQIVKLFSPEHGLSAKAADGAFVTDQIDNVTKLPVVSLYAAKLKPTAQDMEDIDAIVFDIPDVGCRFYTYLWTMTHIMEACAEHQKRFILLDRPNPLSGNLYFAVGPMLQDSCASFLGRWSIPVRHSCTTGELANYFAMKYIPNLEVEVVRILNWNRNDFPCKGNWDFTPTSPAIKDAETALLYPGIGLLEGITINEGRGTDSAFKILGAPWINADEIKNHFDTLDMPGVAFFISRYIPDWGLYEGQVCYGLALKVTNGHTIKPVSLGIKLLEYLISNYPKECKERLYSTNANPNGDGHLDKLLGIENSFEKIKKGKHIHTEISKNVWQDLIAPFLLY